jgi:pyruvate formate lyase activating enzyme
MIICQKCGERPAAEIIRICADCLRQSPNGENFMDLHRKIRKEFDLPFGPPKSDNGILCNQCANKCQMAQGEKGYCGLRKNEDGRLTTLAKRNENALAYMYLDPLPTNCCAAWFCKGSKEKGYNLAVFFYGCNFDCLFCQNPSHKLIKEAPVISKDEMIHKALDPGVRCVCFFGGSPEPQLPFSLDVASKIIQESGNKKHICWEWNGCGNPALVNKAAELSAISGGTIKFDLKCYHSNISFALCGVDNHRAFENFTLIAKSNHKGLLNATTLLVPYYIDKQEVRTIASFISKINPDIPYSLLIFHPDFYLKDLPITPKKQAEECYQVAKSYLLHVHIGNEYLLKYSR